MKCDCCAERARRYDPAKPQRRSPHFVDQAPREPSVRIAERRCPECQARLCNDHSKFVSTMKGMEHAGKRRCSNCATVTHERHWLYFA